MRPTLLLQVSIRPLVSVKVRGARQPICVQRFVRFSTPQPPVESVSSRFLVTGLNEKLWSELGLSPELKFRTLASGDLAPLFRELPPHRPDLEWVEFEEPLFGHTSPLVPRFCPNPHDCCSL